MRPARRPGQDLAPGIAPALGVTPAYISPAARRKRAPQRALQRTAAVSLGGAPLGQRGLSPLIIGTHAQQAKDGVLILGHRPKRLRSIEQH